MHYKIVQDLEPSNYPDYNPKRFSGVVIRDNKARIIIYRGHSLIVTGVKSTPEADQLLNKHFLSLDVTTKTITNITASGKIPFEIDFNRIQENKRFTWEPELFPGIYWHRDSSSVIAIIFRSNKVIITGLRDPDKLDEYYLELLLDFNEISK